MTPPGDDGGEQREATVRVLVRYLVPVAVDWSGAVSTFEGSSLAELATVLVKARIARRWTQRQLAEALGIAEQQVQRYEATEYRSASLARICDVAAALDVTVTERAELRGPDAA